MKSLVAVENRRVLSWGLHGQGPVIFAVADRSDIVRYERDNKPRHRLLSQSFCIVVSTGVGPIFDGPCASFYLDLHLGNSICGGTGRQKLLGTFLLLFLSPYEDNERREESKLHDHNCTQPQILT